MSRARPERRAEVAVPLFGNWRNAYVVVVVLLILEIAAFYFFGRFFS